MSLSRDDLVTLEWDPNLTNKVVNLVKAVTAYRRLRESDQAKVNHQKLRYAIVQYPNEKRPLLHLCDLPQEDLTAFCNFFQACVKQPNVNFENIASLNHSFVGSNEEQGSKEIAFLTKGTIFLRLDHPEIQRLLNRVNTIKSTLENFILLHRDINNKMGCDVKKQLFDFYFDLSEDKFRLQIGPFKNPDSVNQDEFERVKRYFTQHHRVTFIQKSATAGEQKILVDESPAIRIQSYVFFLRVERCQPIFDLAQQPLSTSVANHTTIVPTPLTAQAAPEIKDLTVAPTGHKKVVMLGTKSQVMKIFERPAGDLLTDRECYYILLHYWNLIIPNTLVNYKNSLDKPVWWQGTVADPSFCEFIENGIISSCRSQHAELNNAVILAARYQSVYSSSSNANEYTNRLTTFITDLLAKLGALCNDVTLLELPVLYQHIDKVILIAFPHDLAQILAVNIARASDLIDGNQSKRIILERLARIYIGNDFLPKQYLDVPAITNAAFEKAQIPSFNQQLMAPLPRGETLGEDKENNQISSIAMVSFDQLTQIAVLALQGNENCIAKLNQVNRATMVGFARAQASLVRKRESAASELNAEMFLREHFFRYYGFTLCSKFGEDPNNYLITIESALPAFLKANLDAHINQINLFLPDHLKATYAFQDYFKAVVTMPKAAVIHLHENDSLDQGELAAKTNECCRFLCLVLNLFLVNTNFVAFYIPLLQPESKGGNVVSRITFAMLNKDEKLLPIQSGSPECKAFARLLDDIGIALSTSIREYIKIDDDPSFPIRIDLMPKNKGLVILHQVNANNTPPYHIVAGLMSAMTHRNNMDGAFAYNEYLKQERAKAAAIAHPASVAALTSGVSGLSLTATGSTATPPVDNSEPSAMPRGGYKQA